MRVLLGALFVGVLGCAPGMPDVPAGLTLGAGEDVYGALADGDEVPLVYGPQGGYHLPLALAATGVDELAAVQVAMVGTIDGRAVTQEQASALFRWDGPTARWLAWNVRLILVAPPEEVAGRDVQITASLPGPDGPLTDARTVRAGEEFAP